MPSNHLILCRPLLLTPSIFPSIRVFPNESVLHIRGQSTGVSASASVLPMNIQDWFPLGWTGWISLQSRGLSRVFSNTTVQKIVKNYTASELMVLIIFLNKFYLLIFILFLAALGVVAACGLSLFAASGGFSSLWCAGFSLWWFCCKAWALGSRASAVAVCGP